MAAKKTSSPKPPKGSQRERFIEFAKAHGADDPQALDKAMGKIGEARAQPSKKS